MLKTSTARTKDSQTVEQRNPEPQFPSISPTELVFLADLSKIGSFSKLQLMKLGVPSGIINRLIKVQVLVPVEHPTKRLFKVADGIIPTK